MSADLTRSPVEEPSVAVEAGPMDGPDRGLRPRERVRPCQPNEFRTPVLATPRTQRPSSWPQTARSREQLLAALDLLEPDVAGKERSRRRHGLNLLLDWLERFEGSSWQQRWQASGADAAAGNWIEQVSVPSCTIPQAGFSRMATCPSTVLLLLMSRDGRHAEVGAVPGSAHRCELLVGGADADFESFDLAVPALLMGLSEAGVQVGEDLLEAVLLGWVGSEHGAADARVFVLAGGAVGAAADSELDLASLEVAHEVVPLSVGGFAILLAGTQDAAPDQECPVVLDDVVVVNRDVDLCGRQGLMTEQLRGDVHRRP